jgi:hypothetical protein
LARCLPQRLAGKEPARCARFQESAVAFGRGVGEHQRRDTLSLAGYESRRGRPASGQFIQQSTHPEYQKILFSQANSMLTVRKFRSIILDYLHAYILRISLCYSLGGCCSILGFCNAPSKRNDDSEQHFN